MLRYSVVLPIYNEAGNLRPLFSEIEAVMARIGAPWELVCVDDGSTDNSLALIRDYAARFPQVHYLHFKQNTGQSAALAAGFQTARGEYIITLDSDRQNDPADIPQLLTYLEQYDMVTGWRVERNDNLIKRFSSWFANGVRNYFSQETIKDTGLEVSHINMNDNTVEGLRHKEYPVFTIQYHPEASPGPRDSSYLFADFVKLIGDAL